MSTTNKKGTASKALIEMDSIMKSIKEESKSTMKTLLSEAVKDALRDNASEDEDNEDEYEVVDGENAEKENDAEPEQAPVEEPEDSSMADLEKYKVGEDTYDLTGEKDNDAVVKVYKLLNDDDQVIIKKDGDKVNLKDEETGAEYVIDLGCENCGNDEEEQPLNDQEGEDEAEELDESILEFDIDDEENAEDAEEGLNPEDNGEDLELGVDESCDISDEELQNMIDNYEDFDANKYTNNGESMGVESQDTEGMQFENKKTKKTMKESKKNQEVLFEIDLGYTDNYQKEDPIEGLSNNEPSKSGKTLDKGIPTGTEKPWAGKTAGKGDPFAKEVNEECDEVCDECGDFLCNEEDEMDADAAAGFGDEIEEATNVGGAVQQRSMGAKSHVPANRKEHMPKPSHHVSAEGKYDEVVNEMKKLKKENKALQEALVELRNNLNEAYVTNVNLGKITKLFLENTTTKAEKVDIINRFTNEAKTIEQSKALFESINKQLKKAPQISQIAENKAGKTMEGSKVINENKTQRTKDVLEVIDLMDRMKNC